MEKTIKITPYGQFRVNVLRFFFFDILPQMVLWLQVIVKVLTLFNLIYHPVKCLGFSPMLFNFLIRVFFWHLEKD